MTAAARVDLHYGRTRCMNALTVLSCCLITFDDEKSMAILQIVNGPLEQCRFTRAGGTNEIESEDLAAFKPRAVSYCERIVLLQNRLLQGDGRGDTVFVDVMLMIVVGVVVMMVVSVNVNVLMICNEDLFAGRQICD